LSQIRFLILYHVNVSAFPYNARDPFIFHLTTFQLFSELSVPGFSQTTFCSLSECHVWSSGNAALDIVGHDGWFHDGKGIVLGREYIVTSMINWNQIIERLSSNPLSLHLLNKDNHFRDVV